ncbi:hypothetical protein [Thermocatellispora tengchongensis]|uniref:hypothetical protein n=1 Tax=Thermocatellispora tengchongensis TaxID=1073253 RepID=UPI0036280044
MESTDTRTLPATPQEVVERARMLRPVLAEDGPEIDATGCDPARNMRLLGEAGLHAINVPVEYGGLWDGPPTEAGVTSSRR